jgi:hypothetical protein
VTTYTPKLTKPVVAARLTTDLMVPAGDWVVIDPETGTVAQFTDDQFAMIYSAAARAAQAPKPQQPKSAKTSKTVKSGSNRTVEGALRSQLGRIFYYLRSLGRPGTTHELYPAVLHAVDQNKKSVSAALTVLRDLGLVSSRDVSKNRAVKMVWEPTTRGCEAFDALGPVCFTSQELQVPPDAVTSAPVALARAWEGRHQP